VKLHLLFWIFTLWANAASYAQLKTVTFEELTELQKRENRPVVVYIHTDWCKYCHAMKKQMLKNSDILNQKYYTVFLNAESKKEISFNGKVFKYKATGITTGIHQLAEELGRIDDENSYPALCFLNNKNEIVYQSGGLLNADAFLKILKVISDSDN
jgi:thioredoxin-related protein